MELLEKLTNTETVKTWKYFDWLEVEIAKEKMIISRTGLPTNLVGKYILDLKIILKGDLILNEVKNLE